MNKDVKHLEEAYDIILEKSKSKDKDSDRCDCKNCKECKSKSSLSPKQKKIAQSAPPFDKITGADFASKKDKKTVKESMSFEEVCNSVLSGVK